MKKFLLLLMVGVVAMMTWSCGDDDDDKETKVPFDTLPQAAQTFINQYFAGDTPVRVELEANKYDVRLKSGFEIEFDTTGQWIDVDAPNGQTVPDGIVPEKILEYITANYLGAYVDEISRNASGYEVDLTDGHDLFFDKDCNFIRATK